MFTKTNTTYANSPSPHTVHQISPIKQILIFFLQKTRNQVNFFSKLKYSGFSFQGWLYFGEILLDFGLRVHLAAFSLWGETGFKSRKYSSQLTDLGGGVGWGNGF